MLLVIISLLLIILAPVLQIALSVLRIKGRIRLPLIAIMTLSIIAGIGFSTAATYISGETHNRISPACFTPETAVFLGGILLISITSPVTFILSYIIYLIKTKNDRKLQPPVIG
ncbi:hypothetical protein ACFFGT_18535 [Mucilaginibacter angelicae]|uniref:MotA/TolQ/ExbB proton channel domain-containing protein n=1 Tax=Mucilaginibacter angelicae TaxID=869718 RepID=A0ABV6L9V3_9SPHI